MILTITGNPSLDYTVDLQEWIPGAVNRTQNERLTPGGKGLNVSLILKQLGVESLALGFAAGFTGAELTRLLQKKGVPVQLLPVQRGFTRINVKIRAGQESELNARGPLVTKAEFQALLHCLKDTGPQDTVVLSGSAPQTPVNFYGELLAFLSARGVQTAVDITGRALKDALAFHPFLIKPNQHELGELFGVTIASREQAAHYARKLQEQGARNVLVSLAGQGAVLAAGDGRVLEQNAPKIKLVNSVGAGDSMVAGFLAGWRKYHDYEQALSLGICAGSATAAGEWLAGGEDILALFAEL